MARSGRDWGRRLGRRPLGLAVAEQDGLLDLHRRLLVDVNPAVRVHVAELRRLVALEAQRGPRPQLEQQPVQRLVLARQLVADLLLDLSCGLLSREKLLDEGNCSVPGLLVFFKLV